MTGMIDDFLDMMPNTVKIAALVSRGNYGAPTYAEDVPYRARISNKAGMVRGGNGETIVTKGAVYLACTDPILATARVTLPDGSNPIILMVNAEVDETGLTVYTRLDLG